MSKKIYAKQMLLDALEAVKIAEVKGIFTRSEMKKVVMDINSGSLSKEVETMLVSRKGLMHECGELATIMGLFN